MWVSMQSKTRFVKLWQEMKKQMYHEDVEDIFKLETELFRLVDMRFLGVRVDTEAAYELKQQLLTEEKNAYTVKETSIDVQIWAARSIESFSKTKPTIRPNRQTNSPSFTKTFAEPPTPNGEADSSC